jgi:hypothetical protein
MLDRVPYELQFPRPLSWCEPFVSLNSSNSDSSIGAPQGSSYDDRRSPHSRSPPSVPVAGVSRASRSLSTNRGSAPGQSYPIDPYGSGQIMECKKCQRLVLRALILMGLLGSASGPSSACSVHELSCCGGVHDFPESES